MPLVTRTLDLSMRYFWRLVGRRVDITGIDHWLDSPTNAIEARGDDWLDALDEAGRVRPSNTADGLLPAFSALEGPDFAPARVDDQIRDFYEHTASWRMEVWSGWNTLFAPGGELIARVWGRRVEQLALPVEPLSVSRGMASTVRIVDDETGNRSGAAWLRTPKSDNSKVYSGFYRVGHLPGIDQPHVHVSFPLESGSVQVFPTPRTDVDGSFWLHSRSTSFGAGVLRTDHWLKLGRWQALQLHYRLDRD